jgi:hypothetical protein
MSLAGSPVELGTSELGCRPFAMNDAVQLSWSLPGGTSTDQAKVKARQDSHIALFAEWKAA